MDTCQTIVSYSGTCRVGRGPSAGVSSGVARQETVAQVSVKCRGQECVKNINSTQVNARLSPDFGPGTQSVLNP